MRQPIKTENAPAAIGPYSQAIKANGFVFVSGQIPIDPQTGWAIRSGGIIGAFTVGQEVAIVGFPNHPMWRTPKGIDMMGPRHFGFDEDYVPIEQLHGAAKEHVERQGSPR